MAAKQILDTVYEKDGGTEHRYSKTEWLIGSSSDLTDIPEVAPGSVAYTADLTYMAMYDGEEWHQIGGSD